MISLLGKVAIVTGASRGIGAATAVLLAKAGADIALNYRADDAAAAVVAQQIRALGRDVVLCRGDVALPGTAAEIISTTIAKFGRIDILVNNAGIWTHGEIGDMGAATWHETIDTNLSSVFHLCNALVSYLKGNGGRIINIASTAGQRGEALHAHYAASKGGLLAFTKSLAVELAPYNILVNAVAPGWVDTEMNDDVFADTAFLTQVCNGIPLKKVATAEDVAGAVLFLASEFSAHITGATINVNGGSVLF